VGRATVLLLGFGNPGRRDDGLGPALAEAVAALGLDGVDVDANYQLQVEDAADVAEHDVVLFADADVACEPPFRLRRVEPAEGARFTTHSVPPEAVMAIARREYGAATRGYLLGIRGYDFDGFGERLSGRAAAHLEAAVAFVAELLGTGRFEESLTGGEA